MNIPHHFHLRKRISKNLEPFPATSSWKRLLDRAVFAAGVIGPLMTIPQILDIYTTQNATGVSITSWSAFALLDIIWLIYGFVHREIPIILTYILWFIFNSLVVLGTLMYR